MERLLVLRLEGGGVAAEAVLNGVPLGRIGAGAPPLTLPIHEYTLAGANQLEVVIEPGQPGVNAPVQPRIGDGSSWACLRLLLPRAGHRAHPEFARTLAQIDWAAPKGELLELPAHVRRTIDLPIQFPRWRWLDAPLAGEPRDWLPAAATLLQRIALGLARGDPEPFVQAARLRFEELAAAYQRPLADEVGRFRAAVQGWHARQPLEPTLPNVESLRLLPVAGGRLLECLDPTGAPALASPLADGARVRWPMRLAAIEERLYVLR